MPASRLHANAEAGPIELIAVGLFLLMLLAALLGG